MILIADSGSTKCDWKVIDQAGNTLADFNTMGFNPFFHNEVIISNAIKQNHALFDWAKKIKYLYYYGAGCSTDNYKGIVYRSLNQIFDTAEIHVEHDLTAAIYATFDGRPCISCILGTGSNAAYFDGNKTHEFNTGLGYILGDEGSGSYFGKQLLSNFLYKKLPEDINAPFLKKFALNKDIIFENVYNRPHANVYLAGFVRFLADYKTHPFVQKMLYDGMMQFFKVNLLHQPMIKEVPIHFVGSVAYYYQDSIKQAAADLGLEIGNIVRKPIDGLVKFHLNQAVI